MAPSPARRWSWLLLLLTYVELHKGSAHTNLTFYLPCGQMEYFGEEMSSEALIYAAEVAAREGNLSFSVDSKGLCNRTAAATGLNNPDVLLVPPFPSEDFSLTALLAGAKQQMVLVWFPSLLTYKQRVKYNALIQVAPPVTQLVASIITLLQYHKVTEIAIVASFHDMHTEVAEQTRQALASPKNNITIATEAWYEKDGPGRELFTEAAGKVSVVLVCAPHTDLQKILLAAESSAMLTKEYWFLIYEPVVKVNRSFRPLTNDVARRTHVVSVRVPKPDDIRAKCYCNSSECDTTAGFVYDAVRTYAKLKNTTSFKCAGNISEDYSNLRYDNLGDRRPDYEVTLYNGEEWQVVGHLNETGFTVHNTTVPLFDYSHTCKKDCADPVTGSMALEISLATVGSVLLFSLLVIAGMHTRAKYWRRGHGQQWLIASDDIKPQNHPLVALASRRQSGARTIHPRKKLVRMVSNKSLALGSLDSLDHVLQGSGTLAYYKNQSVIVKQRKYPLKQERKFLDDLDALKELRHDNLNAFIGATTDGTHQLVVFAYCSKGSLRDILSNSDITLDWSFKMSFLIDISRGMRFLHRSPVHSHGNLKSSNCVVDGRWVVKLTDYGLLSETTSPQECDLESGMALMTMGDDAYEKQLWTAPELLRQKGEICKGTQKGDVYSFAIIAQEILDRSPPFYWNRIDGSKTVKDIVEAVRAGRQPLTRPILDRDESPPSPSRDAHDKVARFLPNCWSEDPGLRPDFLVIKKTLISINGNKRVRIVDNMLNMLESYASNLEELVGVRTDQLEQEKKKTEDLLYRMLPRPTAEQLKKGGDVDPESFDAVSIFFSDIVGFTTIASQSTPIEIVNMLNKLYTRFDEIISQHDVYKVETIGDAYMCVSGLPIRNGNRHSAEIANMALDLLSSVLDFTIDHMPGKHVQLRIGLHTGPCVAGVVGKAMPRYCLFGDTVNTASRMESTGHALRIHLSEAMNTALTELNEGFITKPRGRVEVKGKGVLSTYWLLGKQGYTKPLPSHSDVEESSSVASSLVSGIKSVSPVTELSRQNEATDFDGSSTRDVAAPHDGRLSSERAFFSADARSLQPSGAMRGARHPASLSPLDGYRVALLSQPDMRLFRCGSPFSTASNSDAESASGGCGAGDRQVCRHDRVARSVDVAGRESDSDEDDDSAVYCRSSSGGSAQSALVCGGGSTEATGQSMRRASSASCFMRQATMRSSEVADAIATASDAAAQLSDGSQSGYRQPPTSAVVPLAVAKGRRTRRVKRDINRKTYTKRTASVPSLPDAAAAHFDQPAVARIAGLWRSRNRVAPSAALFAGPVPCVLLDAVGAKTVFLIRDGDPTDGMEAEA